MADVHNRIKLAREAAGFTQEKLAEEIGVSRNAVAKWENGKNEPKIENLVSLSLTLGVSSDYLIGLSSTVSASLKLNERAVKALELLIKEIKGESKNENHR